MRRAGARALRRPPARLGQRGARGQQRVPVGQRPAEVLGVGQLESLGAQALGQRDEVGGAADVAAVEDTLRVIGSPSARAAAAVASLPGSVSRPAIQAAPVASVSCTDSCKLSSPAATRRFSRAPSAGIPLVIN